MHFVQHRLLLIYALRGLEISAPSLDGIIRQVSTGLKTPRDVW